MEARLRITVIFLAIIMLGFVAIFSLDALLSGSISREVQIASNIGEIKRLDEVLTMSARMYVSSQRKEYLQRYHIQAVNLDSVLNDTFALIHSDAAMVALQDTSAANQMLVKLELKAIELCQSQQCEEATALLHSHEYNSLKSSYSQGLSRALQEISKTSRSVTTLLKGLHIVAAISVITLGFAFLLYWRHQQNRLKQAELNRAQHAAMVITMTTVMDTFNNALNNLLLYRIKMQESEDFSSKDLQEFDRILSEAKQKLKLMSDMESFKSRDFNDYQLLDYPHATK